MIMFQQPGWAVPCHLAQEMRTAAQRAEFLEQLGVRVAFRGDAAHRTVAVELRTVSGEFLRRLRPAELFDLIALDLAEVESWVAAARNPGA